MYERNPIRVKLTTNKKTMSETKNTIMPVGEEVREALLREWSKHGTATSVPMLCGAIHDLVFDGQARKDIAVDFYWHMKRMAIEKNRQERRAEKTRHYKSGLTEEEIQHNCGVIHMMLRQAEDGLRKLQSQLEGMMAMRVRPFAGERVLAYHKDDPGCRVSQAFLDGINRVRFGRRKDA